MLLVLRQSHIDEDKECTDAAVVLGDRWEEGEEDPWHFLLSSELGPAQQLPPWFGHVTEASILLCLDQRFFGSAPTFKELFDSKSAFVISTRWMTLEN